MTISSIQSDVVGALIELWMMGAYTVVFIDNMRIMYRRRSTNASYIYLLCTSVIIYVLSFVHAVTDAWRLYIGLTSHMDIPEAPVVFFNRNNDWDSWVRTTIYAIITLVSDLFFVYRAWIIWNKRYLVCVIPFLLFLGDVGMAIYLWWSLSHSTDSPSIALLFVASTSKYFFTVTLALTLVCTSLISYKLWSIARDVRQILSTTPGRYSHLSRVASIIFESAAIYSFLLIVMIITEVRGMSIFYILLTMMPPVIGIVFSSIIVRSTSINDKNTSCGTVTTPTQLRFRCREGNESAYPTSPVIVRNEVQVHLEAITDSSTRMGNILAKYNYSGHPNV